MNRKFAIYTIVAALVLDLVAAVGFSAADNISFGNGLYWAVTTATTVGYGDITPHNTLGKVIAVAVMLTVIPLFAATFSLFTTMLTASHVTRETHALRRRLDHIILHHPDIPDLPAEPGEIGTPT